MMDFEAEARAVRDALQLPFSHWWHPIADALRRAYEAGAARGQQWQDISTAKPNTRYIAGHPISERVWIVTSKEDCSFSPKQFQGFFATHIAPLPQPPQEGEQ